MAAKLGVAAKVGVAAAYGGGELSGGRPPRGATGVSIANSQPQ